MRQAVEVGGPGPRPAPRWAWHGWANALVLAWLAAAAAFAGLAAGGVDAVPAWLAVHAFLLGGATTAIVVWSEHFAVAVLRAPAVDRRWSVARLGTLTAGQIAVLAGVLTSGTPLVVAGATGVAAAVAAHGVVLWRLRRRGLGGRLAGVVDYYLAACLALLSGAVLGGLLGSGAVAHNPWHTRVHLAHVHLNVGGWVLLTVLGTLFMLLPTTLPAVVDERTGWALRWCLRLAGPGLAVAVAGFTAGWRAVAVAGLAGYAAGAALAAVTFGRTLWRKRPRTGPAWLLTAATGWLLVAVVADLALVAVTPDAAVVQERLDALGPVVLVGVIGQALVGSLTFLLPVVLGGGPTAVRATGARLNRWWPARLLLLNAAAALAVAGPARPVGMMLATVVALEFLARAAGLVVPRLRWPTRFAAAGGRAAVLGGGLGAAFTGLAVLVATSGGPGTIEDHDHSAAGPARTVEVELVDARVRPATVDVPAGTRLILNVVNRDIQRHDLRTEDGERTPVLRRGQRATLDLGVVSSQIEAWCTVAGHRAAGMTFTVTTSGSEESHVDGHDGLTAYDAALPPADGVTVHRVELPVVEKQWNGRTVWTFGGTVPGPTLRGKVGDVFEVTLSNTGSLGHGIDFHASALAPDGPMRTIEPGQRLLYRFRAERAGIWMYHCSTAPMTQHIAAGMFGAVVIDPPDLAPVDREYVLVASEVYTGEPGSDEQAGKLRAGTPDGWAFNGAAGQYDQHPLTARAGQRVRFWVLNAGPGGTVSFHVVGAQFDTVYHEGAYLLRPGTAGAQTLGLTTSQGGFVETVLPEPGTYTLVDHDMRHAEGGAHGKLAVTG